MTFTAKNSPLVMFVKEQAFHFYLQTYCNCLIDLFVPFHNCPKEIWLELSSCLAYYTLHQKKRMLNRAIFPVDPGSLTLMQGHVYFDSSQVRYPLST